MILTKLYYGFLSHVGLVLELLYNAVCEDNLIIACLLLLHPRRPKSNQLSFSRRVVRMRNKIMIQTRLAQKSRLQNVK